MSERVHSIWLTSIKKLASNDYGSAHSAPKLLRWIVKSECNQDGAQLAEDCYCCRKAEVVRPAYKYHMIIIIIDVHFCMYIFAVAIGNQRVVRNTLHDTAM